MNKTDRSKCRRWQPDYFYFYQDMLEAYANPITEQAINQQIPQNGGAATD